MMFSSFPFSKLLDTGNMADVSVRFVLELFAAKVYQILFINFFA